MAKKDDKKEGFEVLSQSNFSVNRLPMFVCVCFENFTASFRLRDEANNPITFRVNNVLSFRASRDSTMLRSIEMMKSLNVIGHCLFKVINSSFLDDLSYESYDTLDDFKMIHIRLICLQEVFDISCATNEFDIGYQLYEFIADTND